MRLSSDLSGFKSFDAIPRDIYIIRCKVADAGTPENPKKSYFGNPCIQFTWTIEEGEYQGREIRFDDVEIGGTDSRTGEPAILYRLAELMTALEVPWTCRVCHPDPNDIDDRVTDFIRGTGDNGLKKGRIFCPDCRQEAKPDYDTNNFVGKVCKGGIDIRKGKSDDKEYNFIKRYTHLNGR